MIETHTLAHWAAQLKESEIRRLLRVKIRYYMAGGLPGNQPLTIFKDILSQISEQIADGMGMSSTFNYGPTEGIHKLRSVLSHRLHSREGVDGEIMISSGSQQAIYSVLKIIAEPGDVVIAPEPTYLGFLGPCDVLGIRVVTVPMSGGGVQIEELDQAYHRSLRIYRRRPVAIYFPSFADNPTGHSPSWRNKIDVYNFATSHDLLVIEDNAYKEIYFQGELRKPMKSLDTENQHVVYLNTTSKESGVLRIGYSVMPEDIMNAFVKLKGYLDLCTSSLTQEVAYLYYREHIDKILPEIRNLYRQRRDAMTSAIDEYITCERSSPEGGFFVWVDLGNGIDTQALLPDVIKECGVSYVPGSAFYRGDVKTSKLRLSYSTLSPADITYGIKKLGTFLH